MRTILTYKEDRDILTTKSKKVENIEDKEVRELIKDMKHIVRSKKAFGLAAIQLGVPKRIIVINYSFFKRNAGVYAFINPEIVGYTEKAIRIIEYCLSVPGYKAEMERSEEIIVDSITEKGYKIRNKEKGLIAAIWQHELDHLDGKLIIG